MSDILENLTKEELIEEIKKFKNNNNSKDIVTTNPMVIGTVNGLKEQCEVYLVKWDSNRFLTRTVLKGSDISKDTDIVEFIGDEIDVLRPYVGNKWEPIGCHTAIISSDGPCSCQRIKRLSLFNKADLSPVSDEVLNRMLKNWEYIFPNREKPSSFEDLKREYNRKLKATWSKEMEQDYQFTVTNKKINENRRRKRRMV